MTLTSDALAIFVSLIAISFILWLLGHLGTRKPAASHKYHHLYKRVRALRARRHR